MWELFQKIQKYSITPNQCMILFAFDEGVTPSDCDLTDTIALYNEGYINNKNEITPEGRKIIVTLDNYFKVHKKLTDKQLLGASAADNIEKYRSIFPKGKLTSSVTS